MPADELSGVPADALAILAEAEIELEGRMPWSSNGQQPVIAGWVARQPTLTSSAASQALRGNSARSGTPGTRLYGGERRAVGGAQETAVPARRGSVRVATRVPEP